LSHIGHRDDVEEQTEAPSITGISTDRFGSIEAEHRHERLIDGPHLVGRQLPDSTPEPLCIHGAKLLNEHPSAASSD
jgi:hypothetical protein